MPDTPAVPSLTDLVEQAEGDLTALTPDEVTALRDALAAAYAEARAAVTNDEQVEALAVVAESIKTVKAQVDKNDAAAAERAERLAKMDDEVTVATTTEPEPEADDVEDAADEDGEDEAEVDTEDVVTEAEQVTAEAAEQTELVTASAAAPVRARRPNLAALVRSQPTTPAPVEDDPHALRLRGRLVAAASAGHVTQGQAFESADQLGRIIHDRAEELAVPVPTKQKHYLGRLQIDPAPHHVVQPSRRGEVEDVSLMDLAVRQAHEARMATSRLVASGGVCVPPMPDYTITTVGDRGSAWVDGLPTVTGPRPMSFYQWINMSLDPNTNDTGVGTRPATGIGTVTAAEDAEGYGEGATDPKDCVAIDCPDIETESPEASFKCTTIGNFQAITWPEYVRVFDETVGFYFDVDRDERQLAKYVAAAKNITAEAATFGAARDILDRIRRLVSYVNSVRKTPGRAWHVDVPGFARAMVAQDIADSFGETSTTWPGVQSAMARLAIDEGLMFGQYDVSAGTTDGGSSTVLFEIGDGDALPDWPGEIRLLVYPEGGVVRHAYGELSFGLRETGMATNDFSAFYETFESLIFRTSDLFTLDVPLCVNGALGATVEKVCAGS
jgi:hypothetical protein